MATIERVKKQSCEDMFKAGPPVDPPRGPDGKLGPSNLLGVASARKVVAGKASDENAVVFFVREKAQDRSEVDEDSFIEPEIDGVPTDIVEVDSFRALQVHSGMGISEPRGTGGCVLLGKLDGAQPQDRFLLTAGHVLAPAGHWSTSDPIDWNPRLAQPVLVNTLLGHTAKVTPLTRGPLQVDAGLVRLDGPLQVSSSVNCHLVRTLPKAMKPGRVNDKVWKCGATTDFTQGVIRATDACFWVEFPEHPQRWVFFDQQLLLESDAGTDPFAGPGDSGSVVVLDGEFPGVAGLLVAGSLPRGLYLANPLALVLKKLGTDWQIDA